MSKVLAMMPWLSLLKSWGQTAPCFDYSGNFGRVICVLTPRTWPHNHHLGVLKMCLCSLTSEIVYARLKNSKWAICNIHLKVTGWFKTDATYETLLKFISNLSKFMCAQLHFVTVDCTILHNCNNFHTQTELVAGRKKNHPIGLQTAQPKNGVHKDILRLTPRKCPSSQVSM
jgi:hypothetical protein